MCTAIYKVKESLDHPNVHKYVEFCQQLTLTLAFLFSSYVERVMNGLTSYNLDVNQYILHMLLLSVVRDIQKYFLLPPIYTHLCTGRIYAHRNLLDNFFFVLPSL